VKTSGADTVVGDCLLLWLVAPQADGEKFRFLRRRHLDDVICSWIYFALRLLHSFVHCTYNKVYIIAVPSFWQALVWRYFGRLKKRRLTRGYNLPHQQLVVAAEPNLTKA